MGRFSLTPVTPRAAAAARPGGAHRLRSWTARRARLLLSSSCALAVCGSLGPALLSAPAGGHAEPAPTTLTLTLHPTGAAPESAAPPPTAPAAVESTGTAPSSSRPRTTPAPARTPTARPASPKAPGTASGTTPAPTPTPPPTTPSPVPSVPPPAPPTPTSAPVLRRGDTGPQVRRLQTLLLELACAPNRYRIPTGVFDDWTAAVLLSFQRRTGIRGEDGVYGPATRAALEAAVPTC
ncbi:peptidoglycan-binding protein [Kitasatospora sp. NPDC051853]|uniref:peptidoglycan-binding protein n=1 Tax=Kitasatospora sp. NPDC051853 TaxID=3364058 RepID=UPI0037995A31